MVAGGLRARVGAKVERQVAMGGGVEVSLDATILALPRVGQEKAFPYAGWESTVRRIVLRNAHRQILKLLILENAYSTCTFLAYGRSSLLTIDTAGVMGETLSIVGIMQGAQCQGQCFFLDGFCKNILTS